MRSEKLCPVTCSIFVQQLVTSDQIGLNRDQKFWFRCYFTFNDTAWHHM